VVEACLQEREEPYPVIFQKGYWAELDSIAMMERCWEGKTGIVDDFGLGSGCSYQDKKVGRLD
jgi:hypothetical protein